MIEEFDATIVVPPDANARNGMRSAASLLEFEPHERRSDHLRGHQERARFGRRRHGLHRGPHRPLRNRQGRDGFFRRAVRADGQMVAQAKTIAQHLGAIPEAMAAVLAKFGGDLHDGDVVIMNDPYHGGMHLPDIFMFMPIFFGGERHAFAVVICHHTDVGGRVPGSNASDSTEIYQEGLRIPPLKLYDRGVLNATLEALIKINVRVRTGSGAICRRSSPPRRSASAGLDKLLAALRRRRGRGLHAANCSTMPSG